jgi:branched-chain amino acid transport system ATP-binding protein
LGVGRTFQQPRIIKQLTLKENIIFAMPQNPTDVWYQALLPKFVFNRQVRDLEEKAQLLLEQFLLQDMGEDLAETISYGQQKLLNLACTVANGGQLLLLDEPLAGLSPLHNRKICDLLIRLKSDGKTILMIEHHQVVTKDITDQYLFLDQNGLSSHASFGSVQLNIADRRLT